MLSIRSCLAVLAALPLCGCASVNAFTDLVDVFSSGETAYVREAGAALRCGTTEEGLRVQFFADEESVRQWEQTRGLKLLQRGAGAPYSYALIEMGPQPSSGYGVVVSRKAEIDGDLLTLKATLLQPQPDQAVSPKPTQPCSLIALPKGDYTQVDLQDQRGEVVATTVKPAAEPPPAVDAAAKE